MPKKISNSGEKVSTSTVPQGLSSIASLYINSCAIDQSRYRKSVPMKTDIGIIHPSRLHGVHNERYSC